MSLKLNCDMGESFGAWKMGCDEAIMPLVHMANLACGFHASDALTMQRSVALAKKYNVCIGAHPGYKDLEGFGRRSVRCSPQEIEALVLYQLGALSAFCKQASTDFTYVKPHGALYNDMMQDVSIFEAILKALKSFDASLKLMVLSSGQNEAYKALASTYGISLLYEAFLDRNYNNEGFLVPRTAPNALVHDTKQVLKRVSLLKQEGYIESEHGKKLFLGVDSLCVHGDSEQALSFIQSLRNLL